jgi:hypothetical protein
MIHPLAEKIDKAIEEHLPAELGNALKKRIQMLDEAITENTKLKGTVDNLNGENKRLLERVTSLDLSLSQHVNLAVREKAVQAREEKATVFELKAELEAEKRVATGYKEILGGLVRNIEYRNQVFTNEPVAIPVSGGTGYVVQHQGSKVEEKIAK